MTLHECRITLSSPYLSVTYIMKNVVNFETKHINVSIAKRRNRFHLSIFNFAAMT